MACIPGGAFIRGTDTGPKNARPAAKVWQDTYYMDVHEVTMADYRACRKTKACPPAKPLYGDFSRPRQPMVAMSWYDAVSYCRWRGKHLPTEAEWEKAARGPDGDVFPWGSAPATCERAIIEDKRGRSCGVRKKGNKPHVGRTFEIGSRPAYRYGLHDMAGNAWEWVADWYSPSYAACGEACIKDNPKGPCDGAARCPGHDQKLVKGGSWYWKAQYATGFYRRPHDPINKPISHFGFRCAASLDEARALRAAKP
jgi:sulfatase modifying factor 1